MRNTKHILLPSIMVVFLIMGCTKNDMLNELGEVGDFTANIYFSPLSPIAEAGQEIECEIEYWTVGDQIAEEHLMEEISTIEQVEIDFLDVDYTFKYEIDSVTKEQVVYQSYSFDFTNWNPDRNAYLVTPEYEIDPGYKKISLNQNDQTPAEFVNNLSPEFILAMVIKLAIIMEEDGCKALLVDKHQVLQEAEFNQNVNRDGEFSETEIEYCIQQLLNIESSEFFGTKYKYTKSAGISLSYIIINGYGAEAESIQRYFTIK